MGEIGEKWCAALHLIYSVNRVGRVGKVLAGYLTITLRENKHNVCLRLPAEMTYLTYKLSLFLRKV